MASAMDSSIETFPAWLETHLKSINGDVDTCLVEYICGMLDSEEDDESMQEGLSEILGDIAGDATLSTTALVVERWKAHLNQLQDAPVAAAVSDKSFESVLASALQKQTLETTKPQRKLTKDDEERLQVKEAILNLAAGGSDGEDDDDGDVGVTETQSDQTDTGASLLPANMNVQKVLQEQREMRDKSQKQVEAKKSKDKEDREKQKNQKTDKAESEKKRTQKGEKRR